MKKTLTIAVLPLMLACTTQRMGRVDPTVQALERISQQAVDAVLWQHSSAEVYRLFQQSYELAAIRLEQNLARPGTKPPAVVVDIDETILDNSPYEMHLLRHGRVYEPETWKAWTAMEAAPAIPGAVPFLVRARELGCEVFYITNRHTSEREATLQNLRAVKAPFADEAHLLLMEDNSDKTARRAQVAATHRIVLLVGDQLRDMDERFKDRSQDFGKATVDAMADTLRQYFILLPNPMYGTWRDAITGKGTLQEKRDAVDGFIRQNAY